MDSIAARLVEVKRRMREAAVRAGRNPDSVELIAVSKTVDVPRIREGIEAGIKILGENRVQEAEAKIAELGRPVQWHLVGHLQTNKAKQAVLLFDLIHSLDSVHLAEVLERQAEARGKVIEALIEVNLSEEESKSGVSTSGAAALAQVVSTLSHLRVRGLMTIPPFTPDPEMSRPYFCQLRELAKEIAALGMDRVEMRNLSMGMSHDFEVAIEEGATLVRVGTAIFGPRRL